jgi:hypothetical protein
MITSTIDWMEGQVFPADENRCQLSRKSHDRHSCGPDQSQVGYFKLLTSASVSSLEVQFCYKFVLKIYRATSILLCGVSFISFVEPQLLVYV